MRGLFHNINNPVINVVRQRFLWYSFIVKGLLKRFQNSNLIDTILTNKVGSQPLGIILKKLLSLLLLWTIFTTPAFADVVWPSLYIATGMASIKVVIVGLITELFFVKFFTNISLLKASIITVIMNTVTCILGMLLIPISGLFVELLPPFKTFHWTHWLLDYLLAILINTVIEGFIIKLILKLKFKNVFIWLFVANAISILMCILFYGLRLGVKL